MIVRTKNDQAAENTLNNLINDGWRKTDHFFVNELHIMVFETGFMEHPLDINNQEEYYADRVQSVTESFPITSN